MRRIVMKKSKRILLSSVSIVLTVILCLSLVPMSALAAQTRKTPSAADGPGKNHSYISVSDESSKAPSADYSDGFLYAYTNKHGAKSLFGGAVSYDLKSNTLTLNNFKEKARFFEICNMGDDFKIKLSGTSTVSSISAFGYEGECSMNFTGNGTLNVLDYGIELFGNESSGVLSFDKNVTVNASYKGGSAIHVSGTTSPKPLVVKGKEKNGGKAGRIAIKKAEIPWYYDKKMKSQYYVFYNPNKPYAQYSDFAETVYFGINEPMLRTGVTRRNDNLEHDCLQFTLMALYEDEDGFVIQTTLVQNYVWDDDPLYASLKDDYRNVTYDMVDPDYQLVDTTHYTDDWAVVDKNNNAMSSVSIVPGDTAVEALPEIITASLPGGVTGKKYSAQLEATPANDGKITSYKLSGSAADWLTVDNSGLLSGKPTKAGNYTAEVTATETNGSKKWESASVSLTIKVSDPNNKVIINNKVTDKYFHKLVVRKSSDNSVVKTLNINSKSIPEKAAYYLGDLPAGTYEVEFCGEVTGGNVSYENANAELKVEENNIQTVSVSPSEPKVTPNDGSVMINVPESEILEGFSSYFVELTLSDSSIVNRVFSYNSNKSESLIPDILKDGNTVTDAKIYCFDSMHDKVEIMEGEPEYDGNTITFHVSLSDFVNYTVTGIPDDIKSIVLGKSIRSGYTNVQNGSKLFIKKIDEKKPLFVKNIIFADPATWNTFYDYPAVKVEGDKLELSFSPLEKNINVSGKVVDDKGDPVKNATVTISQNHLYVSSSFITVTDENGEYSAKIYSRVPVRVSAAANGYDSKTSDELAGSNSDIKEDITLKKQNAITLVIKGGEVKNATITWAQHQTSGISGDRFNLPVTIDGDYEVFLSSTDTVDTAKATVKVKDGYGYVEMTPTRKGTISWQELDEDQNPVNDYTGYYVKINNGGTYLAGQINSTIVNPGEYTVGLYKNVWDSKPIAEQTLTVTSGETVYFNQKLPEGETTENTSKASFTAVDKAMTGEQYRVSGTISPIDNKFITGIKVESILQGNANENYSVKYASVNGTRVKINSGIIKRNDNPETDWSLPLKLTLYCEQKATNRSRSQTVSVYVRTSDNKDEKPDLNWKNASRVASVTTLYSPSITLDMPEEIGGNAVTDKNGIKSYVPNPVFFRGRVGKSSADVKLYDNGVLCAIAKSDMSGSFIGNFNFADDGVFHEIRAEAEVDGEITSTSVSCSYVPDQATLEGIWLGKSNVFQYAQNLPFKGQYNFSYAPDWAKDKNYCLFAKFNNDDMLDDLTYEVDGKEVTAKVFFKVRTTLGKTIMVPAKKDGKVFSTDNFKLGNDGFINGVKTVFMSKEINTSTKVTFDGEEYDVSQALKRVGGEKSDDNSYKNGLDYNGWLSELYKEYLKDQGSDKDKEPSGDEKDKEEEGKPLTNEQAHEAMTWMLNKGSGAGSFVSTTPEKAAEKAPDNKYILRTYNDSQPWTYTRQNFKLRQQEFQYKGYVASTYTDEATGHQMFMFTGTFYYDRYAMPVPSPTVEKVYSGIKKTEDDPRLFQKSTEDKGGDTKSKMLGSQLDVTYSFDTVTGKWMRIQSATISPGAKSPIHTAASQIPCRTDAPYSYTPANVHMISASGSDSKSKAASGASAPEVSGDGNKWSGIDFSIDAGSIKADTWCSGVISIGGAAYSKFASNTYVTGTKTISKDAPFSLKKWGWKNPLALNEMDCIEQSLQRHVKGSKSMLEVGLTRESIGGAVTTFTLNRVNEATHKENGTANDGLEYLEKQLRDNMRYWGNIKSVANSTKDNSNGWLGNYSTDEYTADTMIRKTRAVADKLTAIQKAVEDSQTQQSFTKNCTDSLEWASLISSLIPEYGTAAALVFDSVSFLLSAAADTRDARVQKAVKEFIQEYSEYLEEDKKEKEYIKNDEDIIKSHKSMGANVKTRKEVAAGMGKNLEDPIDGGGSSGSGGGATSSDVNITPSLDPSGIVYEAVLSNPVEGAKVSLYKYLSDDEPMFFWDDSDYLNQDNPLYSNSEGYYNWDVPEGEWYVTAEKDGYETGSSNADKEATVTHGDYNYLPVMPPQLDVNIPLVSYTAPEVESVLAKTDGIYITFSKYMDESTLSKNNFSITDYEGKAISFTVEKLDSEKAPSNINYGGAAPSYTRTVKLAAKLAADDEVTLKVESGVKSYAGVNPSTPYGEILTVEKKTALKAPVLSVKAGKVDRDTELTITAEEGATIIYTTDGTAPSETNGKKAKEKAELTLIANTTVQAIAVKVGSDTSKVAKADYTIKTMSARFELEEPDDPVTPETKKAKLNKTSAKLKAGATLKLKVTNGKAKSFKSSDKKVATVTKKGKITALKKGKATVTVTLATGKKLKCKVTVKTSPTIKIGKKKFSKKTTYKISKGKKLTVNITGKAGSVNNKYKTTNKKIAKINSKKTAKKVVIKAFKKKGKATVTLTVNGVSFKIKVKVK